MNIQIREDELHLDAGFPFLVEKFVLTKTEDRRTEYHWHSFLEVTRIEQGKILYYVEDRMYEVGPGEYVVFNQAQPHGWEVLGQSATVLVTLFRPEEEQACGFLNCIHSTDPGIGEIDTVFNEILKEWEEREDGWMDMLRWDAGRLTTVLQRLFRDESRSMVPILQRQLAMRRLERALNYMHANFSRPVPLETAAKLCGLSPNYFCSLFHHTMGVRFGTYLQNLRLRHATKLLRTTNRTVLDIAMECGYENESNFYRQYRRAVGHSPGEERRRSQTSAGENAKQNHP